MKNVMLMIVLAAVIGIAGFLLIPRPQRIFALASRTVEFTFIVLDGETNSPISDAAIEIWAEPVEAPGRKQLAQLLTDQMGAAKFVREDHSVEDVIGVAASYKLQGVRRHPDGVGTFVDRYWCSLDISAEGYIPLKYAGLGDYYYDDNGYDRRDKLHRFEFTIPLKRNKGPR